MYKTVPPTRNKYTNVSLVQITKKAAVNRIYDEVMFYLEL